MNPLSKSEYEVLALLWRENRGLTAVEINELAEDKSWKNTSIHLILNSMLDKGVAIVDGMVRSGRVYSRLFRAALTPEEYAMMQVKQSTAFAHDQSAAITSLVTALIDSSEINKEAIERIEELIKKKKESL
ncbi:MAG: BlaI/MecI/CopY family transcriptional regulator [Clostridiales bacterium]|nr:BlaI/MecI/CopY family transcriptional regulator [Clostridiales bacterium]